MIRFMIGRVQVRIHPLLPLMAALAWQMGVGPEAPACVPALLGHETAHAAAARLAGMEISEMELTPFGAALKMHSPWNAGAGRIALIAMAGPAANAGMMCAIGAAAYAGWVRPETAWLLIRANLLLMTVNLVPALPLDGGRTLCALLTGKMGVLRAVRMGVYAGYALSALLLCAVIWIGFSQGVWNIALIGAAAYVCACASREIQAAAQAGAESLLYRRDELRAKGVLPVRMLAVPDKMPVSQALLLMRPGKMQVLRLYDDEMHPVGEVHEHDLLSAFPALAALPLREVAAKTDAHKNKA